MKCLSELNRPLSKLHSTFHKMFILPVQKRQLENISTSTSIDHDNFPLLVQLAFNMILKSHSTHASLRWNATNWSSTEKAPDLAISLTTHSRFLSPTAFFFIKVEKTGLSKRKGCKFFCNHQIRLQDYKQWIVKLKKWQQHAAPL